jgi:hypothetical protein
VPEQYGLKQACLNWFKKLKQGLIDHGFHPSAISPCLIGFVITYANCPIYLASCLQMKIALSTAKAEYIGMSSALHEVIPLMTLMKGFHTIFPVHINKLNFFCKVHEDNQSTIEMATSDKFTP